MDYELRKLFLSENYEVTEQQKQILSILKDYTGITKEELFERLCLVKDPILHGKKLTKYKLEHELGILQGKGLLDDDLNIINLENLDDLIIKTEEPDLVELSSKRRQGFYDGTNTVQQNRKWLRAIVNEKKRQIFTLNPDNKLELVVLGSDRSLLTKNRISLENFTETKETFDEALSNLKQCAGKKEYQEEWDTLLTFLTDYIFRAEGFFENYILDEHGMHSGCPSTVDNYQFEQNYLLDKDTNSRITIKDLLDSIGVLFSFRKIYDSIIDDLKAAKNRLELSTDGSDPSGFEIDNVDDAVNDAIYETSSSIVEYLAQLLSEEKNTQGKDYIEHLKSVLTGDREDLQIIDPPTLFVGLWCLYWRVYYKEL